MHVAVTDVGDVAYCLVFCVFAYVALVLMGIESGGATTSLRKPAAYALLLTFFGCNAVIIGLSNFGGAQSK